MSRARSSIVCAVTNDLNQDQRMHRICSSLYQAGYKVTLVGRGKTGSLPLLERPYEQVRLSVEPQSGPLFYYRYNTSLLQYLKQANPDIVYAVDSDTLMAGAKAKMATGSKLILDAHEYFVEVPELTSRPLKRAVWRHIERKYIPYTDARITVGPALSKVLEQRDGLPYVVVRNVPDWNPSSHIPTRVPKVILYQGVLNKGRGLEAAIHALSYVTDKSIQLHLVGGGDIESQLKDMAANSECKDRIIFHGWLHGDDLRKQTVSAWLGLNLLDGNALNYRYSLANKFFDYMHASVPSLNMDFPEYRQIVERHPVGLLCKELSKEAIAHVINSITPEDHENMVASASTAASQYSWQEEQATLIKVVDTVAQS